MKAYKGFDKAADLSRSMTMRDKKESRVGCNRTRQRLCANTNQHKYFSALLEKCQERCVTAWQTAMDT